MSSGSVLRGQFTRAALILCVIGVHAASIGCMGGHSLVRHEPAARDGVAWFSPEGTADRMQLARWHRSVGPPLVQQRSTVEPSRSDTLTVICWNAALGAGDLVRLVRTVRVERAREGALVLLLQEVYRRGPDVPATLLGDAIFAGRLAGITPGGRRDDVATVAAELGLNLYYVPSMRNGAPIDSDEDRGNAILSNLALVDLTAIELPFERQRRVAVAASVSGQARDGQHWTLRLASAHLDNVVGARRGWIAGGEYARARQARGLVELLGGETPTILAGDFNTWFGFSDIAYVETARAFPQTRVSDTRPTFHGMLRLDHMFFRIPEEWRAEFRREDDKFGSDHNPLVATIRF